MKYHCRCSKCEARRVLRMKPDEYLRPPRCSCGSRKWRIDKWMMRRDTGVKGQGCTCGGYWFTHRRGSLFCYFGADGWPRGPGDEDFKTRDEYEPPAVCWLDDPVFPWEV